MNKLLMIPLSVMFLLSIWSIVDTGTRPDFTPANDPSGEYIEIEDEEDNPYSFNLWLFAGSIILLAVAFAAAMIAGIDVSLFGSSLGVSDYTQELIFYSTIYIGIWGVLTAVSYGYLLSNFISISLWIALTVMYILGVVESMSGIGD